MNTETEIAALMPDPSHSVAILQVCDRHGIDGQCLARETGYSHSQVSRILSGQYPVTTRLTRALYRLTHDPQVVAACIGEDIISIVPRKPTTNSKDAA